MFYNLYNVDTKSVNFWWTGLLLPLAYAQGEELEQCRDIFIHTAQICPFHAYQLLNEMCIRDRYASGIDPR